MKMLYNILTEIQKTPQLYLGSASLEKLYAFVKGYMYCQCEKDYERFIQYDGRFQKYIQEFYRVEHTQSWEKIIRFYAVDEREAFNMFFVRMHEYRNMCDETKDK